MKKNIINGKIVFFMIFSALFVWPAAFDASIANVRVKIAINGKKNITLNNKVGDNIVKFVSSAPLEEIRGSADGISGSFTLDFDNLKVSHGTISVEVASMQTGVSTRNRHLFSDEWLDARRYPKLVFQLNSLENMQIIRDDNAVFEIKADAVGIFSMHGESKEIKAPVTIKYVKESPATKQRADGDFVMITGKFKVALKDFKIKGAGGFIGKKVGEVIDVELTLFGSTAQQ
ncbi:hypothetical protein MASR2M18_14570 [Ignavibacteria bacterium]|nr:YceI family protein [Bacteroidota bacterium]MCZ2133520.1 YceI family protein [Bacteroidota bacterium]